MFVRYDKELIPHQDRFAPVRCIAWSPDSSRLAVCNSENVVLLYDEAGEKRDKFNTKSIDAKAEKVSYVVKGLVFSPDSVKLAIGQSDCAVFVYRLGQKWSDRKVICNKFLHKGPVTCLIWPSEQQIIVGSLEGRVRLANPKTNKCSTIYNTGIMVTALVSCDDQGFLSGHVDGSVVMHVYQDASSSATRKFCSHTAAPYVLLWSQNTVIAAGSDRRVLVYDSGGNLFQQLNYASEPTDREISSAALGPGGQSIALGSYDKFRTYSWSNKKSGWVEADLVQVKNMYTITAMSWKSDGSKIVIGGVSGAVELFDCCLKQLSIGRDFEVSYTGYNQILVKSRRGPERLALRSRYADEISEVKVLGSDRFVVARSRSSLLIGDMLLGKFSEIPWQSAGNEKFFFEFENVCLIFNAGELSLVEYGSSEPLMSLKMNTMNPHVISVRVNERSGAQVRQLKLMAYAVDPKLIAVINLSNGNNVAQLSLEHAVDWLELLLIFVLYDGYVVEVFVGALMGVHFPSDVSKGSQPLFEANFKLAARGHLRHPTGIGNADEHHRWCLNSRTHATFRFRPFSLLYWFAKFIATVINCKRVLPVGSWNCFSNPKVYVQQILKRVPSKVNL